MNCIAWKHPWRELYASDISTEAESLQRELQSELSPAHPLFSKFPKIIGRNMANDDVIAALSDESLAVIHLTWQSKIDQLPGKFPSWLQIKSESQLNSIIDDDARGYEDDF